MAIERKDSFFPGDAVLTERSGHTSVYRMEFPDGWGTMTAHAVLPGLTLIYNDFHTSCVIPESARCPGLVEINHCQAGRYECTMRDGRVVWLGPRDFAVSDRSRPAMGSRFSQGIYQGIGLILEPKTAGRSLSEMLGEGVPRLTDLFTGLLEPQPFLVMRSEPKIQHIFSELYHVPAGCQLAYYKLKTAELMLFLQERQNELRRAGDCYYGQDINCRIRKIGDRMAEDLRQRMSITELAREYQIGESTIKRCFRQMYGEPPYAYLKRRRMEEASFLLTTTEKNITQIAAEVGYQNTSKFSAAFRAIYSMSPSEYKKMIRLD